MVDLQREQSRAMLEASINVVPSCFKSFLRTSLHRVRGAPRGLDHPAARWVLVKWYMDKTLLGQNPLGQNPSRTKPHALICDK